ncbi:universal stress protein [bacterium]|nr:universal stress protein [bacterium]
MKILFCSDGSSQAEIAVRFGAIIAAGCRAETSILGITEQEGDEESLLEALLRARDILKEYDLDAELITKPGRPVREIVRRTREGNYDLVVIGAVRKTTRHPLWMSVDPLWMSARAYKIIESVEPPVLVVIGDHSAPRRILLCTGGGSPADKAVEFAGEIARRVHAVVDLFHALPEPPAIYADLIRLEEDAERVLTSMSRLGRSLRRQKEVLEEFGVFGEYRLRHGQVVPELLKELGRDDYDLVVSGFAPDEDRLHRYLMGDIAREIVNRAELPVLVIRTVPKRITSRIVDFVGKLFHCSKETSEAAGS